tara:strand:+ start:809 stop:1363 length:555 start_codon:yes stop_codon:yes gene_type:complete
MKKLLLLLTSVILLSGCEKEEEVLVPLFEISLDGVAFDPYERYAKVETFGGQKYVQYNNGSTLKKIFILYLQIDDGEPRLDKQHFSLYCLDSDANDNGELLDVGIYTWENPDNKYAGVEIPGDQEYIVWNEVIVSNVNDTLIDLTAEGEFYNPYIQGTMTVSMRLENFPIGLDINATPYGYLLD